MKKTVFYAGFLLLSFGSFSQEKNKTQTDTLRSIKELKVATFQSLLLRLNVEYEHVLNEYSSYGAGFVLMPFGFSVHSFYRYYFSSGQDYGIEGIFAGAFLGIYAGEGYSATPGVGFSVGKKWVHKRGFLLQIHLGFGTGLLGNAPVWNGGIYFGYRFRNKKR